MGHLKVISFTVNFYKDLNQDLALKAVYGTGSRAIAVARANAPDPAVAGAAERGPVWRWPARACYRAAWR